MSIHCCLNWVTLCSTRGFSVPSPCVGVAGGSLPIRRSFGTKRFSEVGSESRVSIRYELLGQSEPGVHMSVIQLHDLGSGDSGEAREKDGAPTAPVIYDG